VNILVTVATQTDKTPDSSIVFAHIKIVVTDSSGASQEQDLDGSESPAFSKQFSVADGKGTVVAQAIDTNGSPIGDQIEQDFDTAGSGGGTGTGNDFPKPTGITVTPA
jgi:hypothetical protein